MRVPAPPVSDHGTRSRYDAIVIGSGIGGAVASALLADAGQSVLVLEKNRRVGGILASYERDGFKLDRGSHLISRGAKGPLGAVLRKLGLSHPHFLTHRMPVRARGMFDSTAPASRLGLPYVAHDAIAKMQIPPSEALHLARLVFDLFTLTDRQLEQLDRITLDELLRSYTRHPGAYFLFAFLASIFFVLPPYDVAAGEALRCLRWFLSAYSLSYVEGGMDSLPHALLGSASAKGTEIAVGCAARSISKRNGSLVVTACDDREYAARAIAANMAPADLLKLIDGIEIEGEYRARVEALRPSGNAHQLKLALDRPLVEEGCLIGGISLRGLTVHDLTIEMMHDLVEDIRQGRISDPLSVYAPVPTNFDPSLAPPGAQVIVASIYGAPDGAPAKEWKKAGLAALASVIPHLEEHLLFAELSPIKAVGGWMGKSSNAAISTGQTVGQVGRDRLPVATPVPGLFICGDGAGGQGIGTELAATSGIEAAQAILRSAL